MRKGAYILSILALLAAVFASPVFAQEVSPQSLIDGAQVKAGDNPLTAANQYKKAAPWRIGFSIWGFGNTWMTQMVHEARYEASLHPEIKQLVFADGQSKATKQIADIEDMIAQKVDAIVVVPISYTALTPVLKEAAKAGIPVVVHSTEIGSSDFTTELQATGLHFGEVGGQFLVKELKGKGKIWVLRGQAGVPADTFRYKGLLKAIKGTDIKIVAEQYGDWSYNKGKRICESLMLSHPDVDGIWSSGGDMSRACIDVFQEFGKPIPPITGEGNNGFLKRWKETGITSMASVFPSAQGAAGIRAAVDLLEGKQLRKHYVVLPPPITNADLDQFVRPDLSDNYWAPSSLPENLLKKYYGIH